jgi:quinol monooxygenase YgiN
MAIPVTVECTVKPEKVDEFKNMMIDALKDTRAFEGCQSVDFCEDQDKPDSFLLYELWESKGHYEKYLSWRKENGMLEVLSDFLSSELVIKYFDKLS